MVPKFVYHFPMDPLQLFLINCDNILNDYGETPHCLVTNPGKVLKPFTEMCNVLTLRPMRFHYQGEVVSPGRFGGGLRLKVLSLRYNKIISQQFSNVEEVFEVRDG